MHTKNMLYHCVYICPQSPVHECTQTSPSQPPIPEVQSIAQMVTVLIL